MARATRRASSTCRRVILRGRAGARDATSAAPGGRGGRRSNFDRMGGTCGTDHDITARSVARRSAMIYETARERRHVTREEKLAVRVRVSCLQLTARPLAGASFSGSRLFGSHQPILRFPNVCGDATMLGAAQRTPFSMIFCTIGL